MMWFGGGISVREDSTTPKTDQQIKSCFERSNRIILITCVSFVVSFVCAVFVVIYLLGGNAWDKKIFWTCVGSIAGVPHLSSCIYCIVNLFKMKLTCDCLKTCGDGKTKQFLSLLGELKKWTIIDIICVLAPPVRFLTAAMIEKTNGKIKDLLNKLEDGTSPA